MREICKELNAAGYKSSLGKPFAYNSLHRILSNSKYIGRYECMGLILEDTVPRLIDDATFEKVQQRVQRNRIAPASAKGAVDFYLTGKLFCGNR